MRREIIAALAAALWVTGGAAPAPAGEPATPQRPTFATDPSTTAAGSIEFEAGVTVDEFSQTDVPFKIKLGMGQASELHFQWSPYLSVDVGDSTHSGPGDLFVGTRYRFLDESRNWLSAAFQVVAKFPTADDAEQLGSGAIDANLAATFKKTWTHWSGVAYYEAGVVGRPTTTGADVAHSLALLASFPLAGPLGGMGEVTLIDPAAVSRLDTRWLLGAAYTPRPDVVIDFAWTLTRADSETSWFISTGVTVNAGVVFRALRPAEE